MMKASVIYMVDVYNLYCFQHCSSDLQSIRMKEEPSAEDSNCLQSTIFQNYSMTAGGRTTKISTILSFFSMKPKWLLIEKLGNTGSGFRVMVN
jgi:hypothetical protein